MRNAAGPNRADASGRLRADRPGARTAADGPGGRGRRDRLGAGACADQYSKQQFYNTIYLFILMFGSLNIFFLNFLANFLSITPSPQQSLLLISLAKVSLSHFNSSQAVQNLSSP